MKINSKIIFDLSEVLICGLVGVERSLAPLVPVPEAEILSCFGGEVLQRICRGEITEDEYLRQILALRGWDVPAEVVKKHIRENFQSEVAGTRAILQHLAKDHEIVLLSDHAREWIAHIRSVHPFIAEFKHTFFSYELGKTKKDPQAFEAVLQKLACPANECWLIDDSAENIRVATAVGISGIQFENAGQLKEELIRQSLW